MENNEIIKEDLSVKTFEQFNQLNEAETLILENIGEFVSKVGENPSETSTKQDTVNVDSNEIENFKNDQREILNKYPSLSDSDRENIFNKMDKVLTNSLED